MKVIDLLNKIATGEEVPEKIKVDDKYYCYDETDSAEFYRYKTILEDELLTDYANLNDEVEIIEDKKIEKLEPLQKEWASLEDIKFTFSNSEMIIVNKINEIIDEVNKMKEGK